MLTVGHFFAGGGGGILASEILGHESVFALEIDKRRCRIIEESGWFPSIHVECSDIRMFDPEPWKGRMDCVAAGFPCQDISCAGSGTGINGPRSGLVWQLFRAIDVIQPAIIFLENSPRIRTKGRREIIKTFVEKGYSWKDGTLKAAHVGAGHIRNRWWCIAANNNGLWKLAQERRVAEQRGWIGNGFTEIADSADVGPIWEPDATGGNDDQRDNTGREETPSRTSKCPKDAADVAGIGWGSRGAKRQGQQGEIFASWHDSETSYIDESRASELWRTQLAYCTKETTETIIAARDYTGCSNWLPIDAGICGMVDGMADKVDRIKTCGDGQVPLQAAVAWALLAWS